MAGAENSASSETETDNDDPGQEDPSVTFVPDENVPRISLRQARASMYT